MPNRILRPWVDSEPVNSLSDSAEVFFVRLIQCADDYGRFYGNPMLLKSYLFPMKDKRVADITRWIAECEKAGLIAYYEISGKRYIEITKFDQRLRMKKESKFPAPPPHDSHMTVTCQSHDSHMTARDERRENEKEDIPCGNIEENASLFPSPAPSISNFKKWTLEDFSASVSEVLQEHQEWTEFQEKFISYWTEPAPSGRPRFSMEKTWETARRMKTWADRSWNRRSIPDFDRKRRATHPGDDERGKEFTHGF